MSFERFGVPKIGKGKVDIGEWGSWVEKTEGFDGYRVPSKVEFSHHIGGGTARLVLELPEFVRQEALGERSVVPMGEGLSLFARRGPHVPGFLACVHVR